MTSMLIAVRTSRPQRNLRHQTTQLLERMLSPMAGLSTSIGFTLRAVGGPRVMTAGGEMTGVHVLNRTQKPRRGYYHIGGSGMSMEEAVIRTLGETAERYSQFVSPRKFGGELRWCSWEDLATAGESVLAPEQCQFYSDEAYARQGFPYKPFSAGAPMSWVPMPSLLSEHKTWVPAQLVLVGYVVRDDLGEPWLTSAVTTGSAAHTEPLAALRNGLLELIQVDVAMGHWYSGSEAQPILADARTRRIDAFIDRYFSPRSGPQPRFYYLRSPDMPAHSVACVLRDPLGLPRVGVGLGCDVTLEAAMYSALLEGVGVFNLAKLNLLEANVGADGALPADTEQLFDLDQNVAWYSLPDNAPAIDRRFRDQGGVLASELPPDDRSSLREQVEHLMAGFRDTGKSLYFLDLTPADLRALGLFGCRVWSPDLLGLALPSAPKDKHLRFAAYGGFSRATGPHPYP